MNLSERDQKVIWHPFTPQVKDTFEIPIVSGKGTMLYDENGDSYIDGIASWWVNTHGHCHPYIVKKVTDQLSTLEHSIFSGFTHAPGVELAERILKLLPGEMDKAFYSDNGSTAVEVALKMALQFWNNQGSKKNKIICFENAYHGDTFGGMSVGARNAFNKAFESLLFDVIHIPVPTKGNEQISFEAMKLALKDESVAAFIFEPLVQGAAGMVMYEAVALDELIHLCRERSVICIADEVMTGFGRTGKMFASEFLQHSPDIICLSKGLTGGFMPLGLTCCKKFIHDAFCTNDKMKMFFHGHSYTGNPTACSAALASLDLFGLENTLEKVKWIHTQHFNFLERVGAMDSIASAGIIGSILAITLKSEERTGYINSMSEQISAYFLERKIILRPLGNVLYLLPPYCISESELATVYEAMENFSISLKIK